ncbi:MAG: Ada metal-binding domain-containing protein [Candidatus Omnitrophota bacterium]
MKKIIMGVVVAVCLGMAACGYGIAAGNGYVASKGSDKYHLADCGTAKKIDAANKVTFATPEEAIKAGYSPCKVCNPPVKTVVFVGSKSSDKYHQSTCKTAANISKENLVTFASENEAEKAGYSPCQLCCKKSK